MTSKSVADKTCGVIVQLCQLSPIEMDAALCGGVGLKIDTLLRSWAIVRRKTEV